MDYEKRRGENKKRRRSLDAIVRAVATGVFVASLLVNVVVLVLILGAGAAFRMVKAGDGEYDGYGKVYLDEGAFRFREGREQEIAVVRVEGFLSEFDRREGLWDYIENPVDSVGNQLRLIADDRRIRGVLLVVDSPGGTVTASDVLYHKISTFREETGIPVVTLMKQVAASGGYYVASSSQHIVAYPTSIVGSIGVIIGSFNFKDLMDRYGVKYVMVKSGAHKGLLSPFSGVDDEDIAILQKIVDNMLDRFVDAVAAGRPNLTREEVTELADGTIYIAGEALEVGLVDEIGYFDDAVAALCSIASVDAPNLVEYRRSRGLKDVFGTMSARLFLRSFPQNGYIDGGDGIFDRFGIYYILPHALR
ncbi:MAG: signal peptide peptidase SppA [Spirochaetes bacterium]|nr:signal peptide peptidase SppA [Spirochaetota bacterium]